ncbi:MAG: outer membrane protein assembly factor BamE [Thermoanaerobaculia bacterium]|nr:outer membrane protein assembly factor BamE [Thermoanaerobaculia bacterium]
MKRRSFIAIVPAVLLVGACTSAPRLNLDAWEIKERVGSQVQAGMSKREVHDILGEPTMRRSQVFGGVEWQSSGERLYPECWYWGSDATICFEPGYGVVYKHAAADLAPR